LFYVLMLGILTTQCGWKCDVAYGEFGKGWRL
jgi:hypothetical protein